MYLCIMKPDITTTAFWDVDFKELDYETNAVFIIEKVFNYGLWADQVAIIKHYGIDRIKQEVVKGAYYKKTVLNFLCKIFDLKPEDFLCYTKRQLHQLPWHY